MMRMIENLPYNVVPEGEDVKVLIETKMDRELTENITIQQQSAKSRNHLSFIVKLCFQQDETFYSV